MWKIYWMISLIIGGSEVRVHATRLSTTGFEHAIMFMLYRATEVDRCKQRRDLLAFVIKTVSSLVAGSSATCSFRLERSYTKRMDNS
jgi:hypothetical protein